MYRDPVVLAAETMNHVTQHATGVDCFCLDDFDRNAAVDIVARTVKRYQLVLIDYCVMTNHVHLLLLAPNGNLPRAMQYLWARLAERYNRRHDRKGHLVRARYGAKPVKDEEQYLSTRAYIAMNPVKAGLCERPEQWRWSGYGGRGVLTPPPGATVRRLVEAQLAERALRSRPAA